MTLTISHSVCAGCERIEQVTEWKNQATARAIALFRAIRMPARFGLLKVLLICVFGMHLVACATPTSKLIGIADEQQFVRSDVQANGFQLLVLKKPQKLNPSSTLHVYLEGDGTPWKYRVFRMRDPTPRYPLMLQLMGADKTDAVYLGRPCYNGTFADSGCSDDLWTSARYSERVVSSMAEAVRKLQISTGAKNIRLFGHSGGGTLALLIAERVPQVTHVVTLAGNLDTEAWIEHHGYTRLFGSLNPAERERLRDSVVQWHFMGKNDSVIPPTIVKRFIQSQPNAFATEIGTFTHGCCWQKIWSTVLTGLSDNDTQKIPGVRVKYPDTLSN